jgi:hypothetical protein
MKHGVVTVPWGRVRRPARAESLWASMLNWNMILFVVNTAHV